MIETMSERSSSSVSSDSGSASTSFVSEARTPAELGAIAGVECSVAVDDRPWLLPIECLAISVGPNGLGELGYAVKSQFPSASWRRDLSMITAERPVTLEVHNDSSSVTRILMTTACERNPQNTSAVEGVVSATAARVGARSAVRAAVSAGTRSLGIPLLGAGVARLPIGEAADATVMGVRDALGPTSGTSLDRIVFICRDETTRAAIELAWQSSGPSLGALLPKFSRSVRAAVSRLAGPTTATALAGSLQSTHSDYAAGRFGLADLADNPDAERRPTADWLAAVRDCYDLGEVERSTHEVIDGRLTVLALAELDDGLASAMGADTLTALRAECELEPTPRRHVRLQDDEPVKRDRDVLNRYGVATTLVAQIRTLISERTSPSFMVHIDGAWGSGKSTLLEFVEQEVAAQDEWLMVRYDAWRQSKTGPPWFTLLQSVRAAVRRKKDHRRLFDLAERRRLLPTSLPATLMMAVLFVLFVVALGWVVVNAVGLSFKDTAGLVAPIVSAASALGLIAASLGRFASLDSRRSAKTFLDSRSDPMDHLSGHFGWLRDQSKKPMLLVVDDLDRCSEAFVVELLDGVQKLMRDGHPGTKTTATQPLIVLVAADGRWLRSSYDQSYGSFAAAVHEPGATVGSLFLEKLFQLTVPVPQLPDSLQASYLEALLAEHESDSRTTQHEGADLSGQIAQAPDSEVLAIFRRASPLERIAAAPTVMQRLVTDPAAQLRTRHALQRYAVLLDPTPRAMKRFVMAFGMLRAVRTAEGSAVADGPLALWTILLTRWPLLAEHLAQSPASVRYLGLRATAMPSSVPAGLVPLFTDPPATLRAVIDHPSGPLDEHAIAECTGRPRGERVGV